MDYIENKYDGDSNPAWEFYKLKRREGLFYNTIICHICKLLPPKVKNGLYRSIGVKIGDNVLIAPYVQIDPFFPELITLQSVRILDYNRILVAFLHLYNEVFYLLPLNK